MECGSLGSSLDLQVGEELEFSTFVQGAIDVKKLPRFFEALNWHVEVFAYSRFIKFSVAPESNRAMASALFNLEWRKV
jgi:hypothetical protein